MLNPEVVTDIFVTALRSLPNLVDAIGGDPQTITSFKYIGGVDRTLNNAIHQLSWPGILVVYRNLLPVISNGMGIWKHVLEMYIKGPNEANEAVPYGPLHLWWLSMTDKLRGYSVDADGLNIRTVRLVNNMEILDLPNIGHRQDQDLLDFFCAQITISETGDDDGPDPSIAPSF